MHYAIKDVFFKDKNGYLVAKVDIWSVYWDGDISIMYFKGKKHFASTSDKDLIYSRNESFEVRCNEIKILVNMLLNFQQFHPDRIFYSGKEIF